MGSFASKHDASTPTPPTTEGGAHHGVGAEQDRYGSHFGVGDKAANRIKEGVKNSHDSRAVVRSRTGTSRTSALITTQCKRRCRHLSRRRLQVRSRTDGGVTLGSERTAGRARRSWRKRRARGQSRYVDPFHYEVVRG